MSNSFVSILSDFNAVPVTPTDFYRSIFPVGSLQQPTETYNLKTNPIGLAFDHDRIFKYILYDDFASLEKLQQAPFSILNGLTYFGKSNTLASANKMYAMIFDLDGVTATTLNDMLYAMFNVDDIYPIASYIVLSGHGVHLYYVFNEPIPLYPYVKLPLKQLKFALTSKLWNGYTSTIKKPQYQGINQGFRVVGGKTKDGGIVKAFKIGKKVDLAYLNEFVEESNRFDLKSYFYYPDSKNTLEEAAKKYPDWYKKVILEGDHTPKAWDIKRDLYDWWLNKIRTGATYGHRYFCIMCLSIYAIKCNIPFDELEKDAYGLKKIMNDIKSSDEFTDEDIKSALECYDFAYKTFPREDISKLSGIEIKKNRRNYQKQEWHLEDMRERKKKMKERKISFKNPEGRPKGNRKSLDKVTQYLIINDQLLDNERINKSKVAREIGLSRNTVAKCLDEAVKKVESIKNIEQE